MITDSQVTEQHSSRNSKTELMKDVKLFRREIADNYLAMFHERLPQERKTYNFLLWLTKLFDQDKQFIDELSAFLAEKDPKLNKELKRILKEQRK